MGRSGNSKGYKIFSISTTIRNPYRNEDFLNCVYQSALELGVDLLKEETFIINNTNLNKIYFKLIQEGIYQPSKVEKDIKDKWKGGVFLNSEEVFKVIKDNPQKTDPKGDGANRVKTQLRALKYQNLLIMDTNNKLLKITNIGKDLIKQNYNDNDLYIKALINMQYGGILRHTAFNKAMPLLNILNIINKYHYENNKKLKKYQFALILAMKDCDYEKTYNEIKKIEFLDELDQKKYLINKVNIEGYSPINFSSFEKDYIDEVYRKIGRTGLFEINSQKYIGINKSESKKIELLISQNSNYSFKEYTSIEDYYKDIESYKLPWEIDIKTKEEVLKAKAVSYNIKYTKVINLNELEKIITKVENKIFFEKFAKEININYCYQYIMTIIDSKLKISEKPNIYIDKTMFEYIKDFIKLEWFFSIILYKLSGDFDINPGSNFDQYGYPKSQASGGKADIEIFNDELYGTLELTTIKNKQQLLNNESTSIARHLLENLDNRKGFSLLLAPLIHSDVIHYLNYIVHKNWKESELVITGSPIPRFLNWIKSQKTSTSIKLSSLFKFAKNEFIDVKDKNMIEITKILSKKNLEKYI